MAEKVEKLISRLVSLILIGALVITVVSFLPQPARGDDQVTTWGTVLSGITCAAEPSSLSFGTITTGSVKDADDKATTTITANTIAYLKIHDWGNDTDPGLYGATTTGFDIIVSPNAAEDATATLSGGTEGYGIRAATTTAGTGGDLTIAKRYRTYYLSGFDPEAVGGIVYATSSALTIASSTEAINGKEVVVTHKAAISGATEAGDYRDTIVYTCSTTP